MKRKRYLPFGYQMKEGQLVPHPQEASLVKEFFRKYLEGVSLNGLAKIASLQGIPYREDAPAWNKNAVSRLLQDSRYTGNERFPAILPEEIFQKAAALHTAKAAAHGGRLTPLARPFRDKLRCGVCGEPCKRDHTRTGEIHWICPHCQTSTVALPDELLVRKVIVLLNKAITHPEIIDIPAPKREAVPINVVRLEKELDRKMRDPSIPTSQLLPVLFALAKARYDTCDSGEQARQTDFLRNILQGRAPLRQLDTELLRQACKSILIYPDGHVSLVLINSAIL